ncbi:carboxy terminal-processing peptidase [Pseudomonas sp. NW5]|uniref:carboxy terminal-processing peptidase n=1 Tax=Pseudomonas sp. NW5 TaxID=2934934 RepID=UPI00201FDC32|nr:carboxy terminal-processing peptidase [Pseudomonas sp. NW5]MCL7462867.1 carboxy terminal-processing peptidase [Pseudomonas sp. NW5]
MKPLLPRTALALALALTTSLLSSAATAARDLPWESLNPERSQVIASLNVIELLKRHHYSKPPLDDARSAAILDNYLKMLDPARSYFTAQDIAEFEAWRYRFDDFLQEGNLEPGFALYKRQLERQQERLSFALELLEQRFAELNFNSEDTLETDREKAPWAADRAALDTLWRQRVKDEVLRLKIAGKEPEAIRELLVKRYRNQLKRLAQTRSEDIFQAYLNAFTQTYDPHTTYLSPDNAENFDINMSLSLEGIGAILQNDNEYVKIVRLIPAGPAEKSKLLAPADRIVGVAQGEQEMVDVIGWRLDEVVKLIRGPKGTTVRLEVIPASNAPNDLTSKVVDITREAVKLEEQAAKKSVIEITHEGANYRLGVIEIPAFYLDFKAYRKGDPDYKSTTRDVRRLLGELRQEKVDGVIIDLRNNGGGSLQEANELTGLFIDRGPTVLVRNSDGRVDVLADDAQGVVYAGPMAVLVNRLSASASEIFAGAMQDYHRALIIGGQTFGKGTVQSVQPLNHGELKLTMAKFYRVSGQSTQHQGVLPDISYPTRFDLKQIGESALPAAMPWDSIRPAIRTRGNPFTPFLAELKARHEARTANDPDFVFVRDSLQLTQSLQQETRVSLNEQQRRQQQQRIEARQLALENARRAAKGEPLLTALKQEEDNTAEEPKEISADKDTFLTESGRILLDYLNLRAALARQ